MPVFFRPGLPRAGGLRTSLHDVMRSVIIPCAPSAPHCCSTLSQRSVPATTLPVHEVLRNAIFLRAPVALRPSPPCLQPAVPATTLPLQDVMRNVIIPMRHPGWFHSSLLRQQRGVLLYGPPGTGARLTATTACVCLLMFLKGVLQCGAPNPS